MVSHVDQHWYSLCMTFFTNTYIMKMGNCKCNINIPKVSNRENIACRKLKSVYQMIDVTTSKVRICLTCRFQPWYHHI